VTREIIIIIIITVETDQGGNVTILWNHQVQTDRTIPNNKPHIITRDNEKRTCMLIDVAISGDRNVIKKEAEKILKYKDLTIEIQRMWNVKTNVIPIIIGARLGPFQSHLENT
jgi:polysaccharide pyruvyl transferase WcaK-like protein